MGWRLGIRRHGTLFQRSFNAAAFGGLDGALQAALALRDEFEREHPVMSKREWCATLRSDNTSGVPGVGRISDRFGEHWKAQICLPDGRMKTRQFSFSKYGEDRAYRLAVEARRKLLALVEGAAPSNARSCNSDHRDVHFDDVLRQPAHLYPQPNPYAPPPTCEVVGVRLNHVNPLGRRTSRRFDARGNLTAIVQPDGATTAYIVELPTRIGGKDLGF